MGTPAMKALKAIKGGTQPTVLATATSTPKSKLLQLDQAPGVSMDKVVTNTAAAGLASNAALVVRFSQADLGELSLTDMVASLRESGKAVNSNDLSQAERMLNAQAVALNSIFGELARRSSLNMGEYLDASERYMRLALKAQGQCRATLETLAAIKNPPVVFARQANISNGPQQVVNNGVPSSASDTPAYEPAHGEGGNEQTKLLEGAQHGGTYLDIGAAPAAARGNPELEAVGAVHRPTKPRRQGARPS